MHRSAEKVGSKLVTTNGNEPAGLRNESRKTGRKVETGRSRQVKKKKGPEKAEEREKGGTGGQKAVNHGRMIEGLP